jgi:KDO2-lipid IV(A) lauroyltransferase
MSDDRKPLRHFWTPRYWPTWLGMAALRLVCLLPHRGALAIGRILGRIAERLAGSRRAIVRRNIEL